LLANPGFVLPQELDRLAAGALRDRCCNENGEAFYALPGLPRRVQDAVAVPTAAEPQAKNGSASSLS
jgi:hypothetical protein